MASEEAGPAATLDGPLREDALDVLRDARVWRLTAARWRMVAQAVEDLAAAVRAGDRDAARSAVYQLELAGPVRATGIGEEPIVPAPEPVSDVLNELIHTIDRSDERSR